MQQPPPPPYRLHRHEDIVKVLQPSESITAMAVAPQFLVVGTSMGSLYVFDRAGDFMVSAPCVHDFSPVLALAVTSKSSESSSSNSSMSGGERATQRSEAMEELDPFWVVISGGADGSVFAYDPLCDVLVSWGPPLGSRVPITTLAIPAEFTGHAGAVYIGTADGSVVKRVKAPVPGASMPLRAVVKGARAAAFMSASGRRPSSPDQPSKGRSGRRGSGLDVSMDEDDDGEDVMGARGRRRWVPCSIASVGTFTDRVLFSDLGSMTADVLTSLLYGDRVEPSRPSFPLEHLSLAPPLVIFAWCGSVYVFSERRNEVIGRIGCDPTGGGSASPSPALSAVSSRAGSPSFGRSVNDVSGGHLMHEGLVDMENDVDRLRVILTKEHMVIAWGNRVHFCTRPTETSSEANFEVLKTYKLPHMHCLLAVSPMGQFLALVSGKQESADDLTVDAGSVEDEVLLSLFRVITMEEDEDEFDLSASGSVPSSPHPTRPKMSSPIPLKVRPPLSPMAGSAASSRATTPVSSSVGGSFFGSWMGSGQGAGSPQVGGSVLDRLRTLAVRGGDEGHGGRASTPASGSHGMHGGVRRSIALVLDDAIAIPLDPKSDGESGVFSVFPDAPPSQFLNPLAARRKGLRRRVQRRQGSRSADNSMVFDLALDGESAGRTGVDDEDDIDEGDDVGRDDDEDDEEGDRFPHVWMTEVPGLGGDGDGGEPGLMMVFPRDVIELRSSGKARSVVWLMSQKRYPEALHLCSRLGKRAELMEVADAYACWLWDQGEVDRSMEIWGEYVLPRAPSAYWAAFARRLSTVGRLELLEAWLPFNNRALLPAETYLDILKCSLRSKEYDVLLERIMRWPVLYPVPALAKAIRGALEAEADLDPAALRGEKEKTGWDSATGSDPRLLYSALFKIADYQNHPVQAWIVLVEGGSPEAFEYFTAHELWDVFTGRRGLEAQDWGVELDRRRVLTEFIESTGIKGLSWLVKNTDKVPVTIVGEYWGGVGADGAVDVRYWLAYLEGVCGLAGYEAVRGSSGWHVPLFCMYHGLFRRSSGEDEGVVVGLVAATRLRDDASAAGLEDEEALPIHKQRFMRLLAGSSVLGKRAEEIAQLLRGAGLAWAVDALSQNSRLRKK